MNSRKISKLISVIICAAVVMCQLPCIAFADAPDSSAILKDSIALKANCSRYAKGGNAVEYYNNAEYYPEYKDGEFMVPFDVIKNVLGCTGTYDAKKETAELKKDGKTVRIRAGEDGIYYNGTAKYITNKAERTKRGMLIPFDAAAKGLGYNIAKRADVVVATPYDEETVTSVIVGEFEKLLQGDEVIMSCDFENGGSWGYAAWNSGSAEVSESSGTEFFQGQKSMYIGTTQKGFIGMTTSKAFEFNRAKNYRVRIAVKKTSDYKNNDLTVNGWCYNSAGQFIAGLPFNKISTEEISTEWQCITYEMHKYRTRQSEYNDFQRFNISIQQSKTGSEAASGGVYIDNFVLEEYQPLSENVACDFVADKFAAWYQSGDTVTYTTQNPNALKAFKSVKSKYYDSEHKLVYEQENPVESVIESGIKFKPENVGFYTLNMYAVSSDGTERPIANYYRYYNGQPVDFLTTDRTFAVVEGTSKPMEERNDMLMFSGTGTGVEREFQIADMLGFSGVRIHNLSWGSGWGSNTGIEDKQGVYNFTHADIPVALAEKYNMKNIMANVFSTPIWAVDEKYQDTSNVSYMYMYQKMAPVDMQYLADFIKEFYNHYKGRVDILEFWNEPHYGNTAFWADTPEKLSEMIKTSYKALREVDPDGNMKYATASWNQGYQLFHELAEDKDFYNSTDYFTFHSRTATDIVNYRRTIDNYGYEVKPEYATEEYLYAGYKKGVPKDHDLSTMHYMAAAMSHIKMGLKGFADFELTDNIPDEVRVWCGQQPGMGVSHTLGLFSSFPYVEPHKGAVAVYNWYKSMGLDYTYDKEYDFGGGVKAVQFMNDGKPELLVWSSTDTEFKLTDGLKAAAKDDTSMIDFMGRTASLDDTLKAKTVYIIKNLDKDVLDNLESKADTALNSQYEEPYYTCKLPEYDLLDPELPEDLTYVIDNPTEKPFNEKTFALSENVNWISDNWNWVGTLEKPANYSSKFAAHVDKDGLYLLVDTTDNTIYTPTDGDCGFRDGMWEYDSVQFAVDCLGTGLASQRAEFQVGIFKGEPIIYKHSAPDIGFNMVSGWSNSNTQLKGDYVRIDKTDHGNIYKIFVPMSELFPFQYSEASEFIRFSLLVNNNDGNGRCYNEWSSGIGGDKDPKQFGAIKFK